MNGAYMFREWLMSVIAGKIQAACSRQAQVTAIDEETDTCTIMMENVEYDNVPIKTLSMSSNVVNYPAVGSYCDIYFLEGNNQVVRLLDFQDCQKIKILNVPASDTQEAVSVVAEINISELDLTLDSIKSTIKENTYSGEKETKDLSGDFKLNADNIIFNGGNNGGLVLVKKMAERMNKIENLVNDFIAKYNAHTHVLTLTMGTGTAAPTTSSETGTLSPTSVSDIENTKIKQ